MNALKSITLAAMASLGLATAASATDLYTSPDPVPAIIAYDDGASWEGFYIGKFAMLWSEDLSSNYFAWGGTLGYNWESNGFVYGVEKSVGLVDVDDLFIEGQARVGLPLGANDGALLYGAAGIGWVNSTWYALPGAGIEVMLSDRISVDAGADVAIYQGGGGFSLHAKAGLNFHLN